MTAVLVGCIADDVTGATDLAEALAAAGLRTTLSLGVPGSTSSDAASTSTSASAGAQPDAVVVALKIRTVAAADATAQALAGLRWLRHAGAERIFWKYCSTFDSTDAGNIGPVADALLDALGATSTVFCPAFPAAGRTVYAGHLFVGDVLLSASSMRHHPLTPMTDADLVAVLGRQTRRAVGLVHLRDVLAGEGRVAHRLATLHDGGATYAVLDAVTDDHLSTLGRAVVGLRLVTGGSGLGGALARALVPGAPPAAVGVPAADGPVVILSGSCSEATRAQVDRFDGRRLDLDPWRLPEALDEVAGQLRAAMRSGRPVLVTSTAGPAAVAEVQRALGRQEASERLEAAMGHLARVAVDAGARRLVVAGGETAGAVTAALGLRLLDVGPSIAPGVPWTATVDGEGRALALVCKSGNFGGPDFFTQALATLERAGGSPATPRP